jgi:hypothetical protein
VVAALATVAFGGSAAPAQAAGTFCSFNYEQPFYGWSDTEWYGLAPGSNFPTNRTPSGWSLAGKAAVVAGGNPNRPWSSDYSLYIPANGSATTPAFCVDQYSPYSRMFGTTTTLGKAGLPGLKVDLIYTNSSGKSTTVNVANLAQQSGWSPTGQFPLISGSVIPKWDSKGQATVKYKFTAINSSAWRIDDLFIDPKRH